MSETRVPDRGTFTTRQRNALRVGVQPYRVYERDGASYLPAWDVIAHLNRIFGFEGWDKEILSLEQIYEGPHYKIKNGEPEQTNGWDCAYLCSMRLTIRDNDGNVVRQIEDASTGDASNQRTRAAAHDLAMKSAISTALKRCAKDLGDQFGLSLYNGGQESAIVGTVLPYLEGEPEPTTELAPEHEIRADGIDETEPGEAAAEDKPNVREPKAATTKTPEATPPVEATELEADPVKVADWNERISKANTTDALREIWNEIKGAGLLDYVVAVTEDDQQEATRTTLRELVVACQKGLEADAA